MRNLILASILLLAACGGSTTTASTNGSGNHTEAPCPTSDGTPCK